MSDEAQSKTTPEALRKLDPVAYQAQERQFIKDMAANGRARRRPGFADKLAAAQGGDGEAAHEATAGQTEAKPKKLQPPDLSKLSHDELAEHERTFYRTLRR